MKKIYFVLLALFAFSTVVIAQSNIQPRLGYEEKGIIYNKEFTVDFRLHTHGFALGANVGKLKTYYLTRYFNFELGHLKHPKEFRQSFDSAPSNIATSSRSYIFGKQNNFYVLRVGMGIKKYFSEKARKRGLAVGATYEAGPSLGVLKPYHLQIIRYRETGGGNPAYIREEAFSEFNANEFLNVDNIYGSGSTSKGFGDLSLTPGLHGKAGIHFDWGAFDEFVKAIEAGIMVDVYFRKIPIMVDEATVTNLNTNPSTVSLIPQNIENRPFFINFFLNLQLGKRW